MDYSWNGCILVPFFLSLIFLVPFPPDFCPLALFSQEHSLARVQRPSLVHE